MADRAGFCFGVQRAVDLALANRPSGDTGPTYILGHLVHNQSVVDRLEDEGLVTVTDPTKIRPGRLVLSSHGVSPQSRDSLESLGFELVDATCPFVAKAQREVAELSSMGRLVIIVGDEGHPEVVGLVGFAVGRAVVIDGPDRVAQLIEAYGPDRPVGVVAQTTQNRLTFDAVVDRVRAGFSDVVVRDTICTATEERQRGVRQLAPKVDLMVIVGGRSSANTRRLYELSRSLGTPTLFVESAEGLDGVSLSGAARIGVAAGASTPSWVIKEVVNKMEEKATELNNTAAAVSQEKTEPQDAGQTGQAGQAAGGTGEEMVTMSEALGAEERKINEGEIVTGRVVSVGDDDVLVDIGYKSEAVIPRRELSTRRFQHPSEVIAVGDEISAVVLSVDSEGENNVVVSKKRADLINAWAKVEEAFKEGKVIEGKAVDVVKGGVTVDIGLRGFVPASQIGLRPVADLSAVVGKTLTMKILEVERERNNVVLSQRAVLEERQAEALKRAFEELKEGQVVDGTVTRLTNFGAFVDIGDGVEGLLHVSDISWNRIGHPSHVLKQGDKIKVAIIRLDKERQRISLGLKQIQEDPWTKVPTKYPVGTITVGRVTRLTDFGAFVELEPGVEGLVHVSQISRSRVEKPSDVLKENQEVQVKVISLREGQRRIGLSIKEADSEVDIPVAKEEDIQKSTKAEESGVATIGDLIGDKLRQQFSGTEKH